MATSIFDGSAKFASAIGVPLIGILLLKVGWRWSFAATGLISFLYFLLFCRVYRDPGDDPELTTAGAATTSWRKDAAAPVLPAETASLGYLISQPKVIGIPLALGPITYIFYLLLTWLPSYLSSALHIDLLHSFLYTGVPWLIGTASEMLIGGWLVDRLLSAGWNARSRAAHRADRRNDHGAWYHRRGLCPDRCQRPSMDQPLACRTFALPLPSAGLSRP